MKLVTTKLVIARAGKSDLRRRTAKRRGAVFVIVLLASLVVASMTLAAAMTTYRAVRLERDESQLRQVQVLADSGLEWALSSINQNSSWRTTLTNNTDVAPIAFGPGTLCYRVIDSDGKLNDQPLDSCDLMVTATVGEAVHVWRCGLEPAGAAVNALNYSVASSNDINVGWFGTWSTDQSVATPGSVKTMPFYSYLTGNTYALGSITGLITGNQNSLSVTLEMPDAGALEFYRRNGSNLSAASLPLVSGERLISGALLTATNNTLGGELNAKGIYIIDGGGAALRIKDSRLQATVVVRNASSLQISGAVLWEAAQGNYPCLLADCPVTLDVQRDALRESTAGRNLNPASSPYRGQSDSNTSSSYPSQLRGLFFTTKAVAVAYTAETEMVGCLLCNGISGTGKLFVNYRSVFANNPPPGFRKGPAMGIAQGTIRRVAAP